MLSKNKGPAEKVSAPGEISVLQMRITVLQMNNCVFTVHKLNIASSSLLQSQTLLKKCLYLKKYLQYIHLDLMQKKKKKFCLCKYMCGVKMVNFMEAERRADV